MPVRPSRLFRGLVVLAFLAPLALASTPRASPDPVRPASPSGQSREVDVSADFFGVGDVIRPGDWAGVRIVLTDRGDRFRDAAVRLHVTDADGDTQLQQRVITLNPGRAQATWIYSRLPFTTDATTIFTVTVHEVSPDAPIETDAVGRQIGAARIQPRRVLEDSAALIGAVGRARVGLDIYSARAPRSTWPGTAHEPVDIVSDLVPAVMPDRWMGLAAMESIVWVEGEPAELSEDAASALREWVRRGGHLVVVLPAVGQTWTNPRNPLADLMPAARAVRREDVDLEPYRPILLGADSLPLPGRAVVHTFIPVEDAAPDAAMPIIAGPDRECVVIRRLVGVGAVTLVGFDLGSPRLANRVRAQAFWHRVLGKRAAALTTAEMTEREGRQNARDVDFTQRQRVFLDDDIADQINMTGRAGIGVMLALIVFAAYLAIAGPIGFAVLKARGLKHHSWVAFVATAGVFTMIAWGGASALRPTSIEVRHLTFIDHVYAQDEDRARAWFSVVLPTYGQQTVSLREPGAPSGGVYNALSPWDNPAAIGRQSFPDARGYVVETRAPDSLSVPTRSTVKQFQADWLGAPPWKMPSPVGDPPRIDPVTDRLTGVLRHDLPAALENVNIILVKRQAPLTAGGDSGPLLAVALAWTPPGGDMWPPDVEWDLSAAVAGRQTTADAWLKNLAGRQFSDLTGRASDPRLAPQKFTMIAFAPLLEPPNWQQFNTRGAQQLLQRRATHSLDLARWFTQPCIIIVGQLADAESPVPVFVDGERARTQGRTIIRWVYPLAPDPVWPAPAARETEEPT